MSLDREPRGGGVAVTRAVRRPLALDDAEFAALRTLLARAAGLDINAARRDSLACSVGERMRATGTATVAGYLALVSAGLSDERQLLLDEVTIQETYFFRNPPQIQALRDSLLPELIAAAAGTGRRLRIWSAGCSTGEEAYTVAMLLHELLPSRRDWDLKVVATDVSQQALAAARAATYGPRAVHAAAPSDVARFFVSASDGRLQVRPEIAELVEFRHHNLITEPPPFAAGERVDLVLCRNVTIYFHRDTTRALVQRLHATLRDGGYLLLGHAETLWKLSDDFRLVVHSSGSASAFLYRRQDAGPPTAPLVAPRRTAPKPSVPPPLAGLRPAREMPGPPGAVPAAASCAPTDPAPVLRLTLAQGRYEEAAQLAAQAAVDAPLRADLHYVHGLALVEAGRDADALPALRRAVYLDPDAGLPHFLLAGALRRLGDAAAAAREYRAAAATLGRRPAEQAAPELGGRRPAELAALCARLADQLLASA